MWSASTRSTATGRWKFYFTFTLVLACSFHASTATTTECPPATQAEALKLQSEMESFKQRGQWDEASARARCLVMVASQMFGPTHATTVNLQRDLASMLHLAGRPDDAHLIERQIESGTPPSAGGARDVVIDRMIVESKSLLDRGDVEGAGKVCREARRQIVKQRLERTLQFAVILNECGRVYEALGDYDMAEQRYTEAIELARTLDGPRSRSLLAPLNNLGLLYWKKEDEPQRALQPLQAVIEMDGKDNPDSLPTMNNLALIYSDLGREDDARAQLVSAQQLAIRSYGELHPSLIEIYNNLATQACRSGSMVEAIDWQVQANNVAEHNLRSILAMGSERQKLAYSATLSGQTNASVGLSLFGSVRNRRATRMALDTVLQRKGRVLDVMAENFAVLRASMAPQDQEIFDVWRQNNAQYATLLLRGQEQMPVEKYRELLADLKGKVQKLELRMLERIPEYRHQVETVTAERVQQLLPDGAVLVEWFRYRPYIPKMKSKQGRWGAARYAAYVLKPEGEPVAVDIGEAAPIETAIVDLQVALQEKHETVGEIGRELDERLMQPLRPYLGGAQRLLVSPDGQLNLLPFGVLTDAQGRYLIQSVELTYLTSGRDLLRFADPGSSRQAPLVFANPDYGPLKNVATGSSAESTGPRSADMRGGTLEFKPLKGTEEEARVLKGVLKLKDGQILTGAQASEAAIKQVKGPRVLHLATHGFFLEEQKTDLPSDQASGSAALRIPKGENPLLRSGLALAGANQLRSGDEDGILTALEVSGLDLGGTELVVLSACETGLGQVHNGEGVYGLRRALVLAGVQTQVASLWRIGDNATPDLMVDYYRRLANGTGRSQALRDAQLAMLKNPARAHPFYWAAFVAIGNGGPMRW